MISFANPATLARYQQELRWPFPIFANPTRTIYRALGVGRLSWVHVFSPATLWLYVRLLAQNRRPKRYGDADVYQGGGDFLVDRSGKVLFAYPGRDPADRPSVLKLLDVIERIIRERGAALGSASR